MNDDRDDYRWYVVFSKPRQEAVAEKNLCRQGFRVYLPRMQLPRRRRGRWLTVVEPLFPRYLFVYLDTKQTSVAPIRSTYGVTSLVRFAERLAVIPSEVIGALAEGEDKVSGLHAYGRPLFHQGDPVQFTDGPFAGLQGVFHLEDGDQRAIVLLELLGKLNRIKVPRDWLVPVG